MAAKINTSRFYFEWHGHTIPDITTFHNLTISLRPSEPIIYLAGDSSLDNKHWVPSSGPSGSPLTVPVPSIYAHALAIPQPKPDVAFWLNHLLGEKATVLNLAVEESTLRGREKELDEHDIFIRDHIRTGDFLIVSVGANDIALKPTAATIRHMLQLAWLTPRSSLSNGTAWSLNYFTELFKTQVENYVSRLVVKTKPRAVVVCMIYFPLEAGVGRQTSWADVPLKALGYNWFPGRLQSAIRAMNDLATRKVTVEGTKVVPCAMFEVLDGKNEGDYAARVEPSAEGGRKMAVKLMEIIDGLMKVGEADDSNPFTEQDRVAREWGVSRRESLG